MHQTLDSRLRGNDRGKKRLRQVANQVKKPACACSVGADSYLNDSNGFVSPQQINESAHASAAGILGALNWQRSRLLSIPWLHEPPYLSEINGYIMDGRR